MQTRLELPTLGSQHVQTDSVRLWRLLIKHRWMMAISAVATFAAIVIWTVKRTKIYEAQATVIIDPQAPKVLGTNESEVQPLGSGSSSMWASQDYYNTQQRILRSWSLADRVIRRFELANDPHLIPAKYSRLGEEDRVRLAAQSVLDKLRILPVRESRVFGIAVRDSDPRFAAKLANWLVDVYTDQNLALKFEATRGAARWVATQVDQARDDLTRAEHALHDFRAENNILSVGLEDKQNMITNALGEFQRGLTDVTKKRIDLESKRKALSSLLDGAVQTEGIAAITPSAANADRGGTGFELARNTYVDERRKLNQLEERYGAKHPEVVYSKVRLEGARKDLERETRAVLRATDAEIEAVRDSESRLRGEVDRTTRDALKLNDKEVEYKRLVRTAENSAQVYSMLLKRQTETGLQQQDQANNIRRLDVALVPTTAVEPNMTNAIVLASALALMMAFALALVRDFLDRTVKTQEDVETSAGVSVLGFVPSVEKIAAHPQEGPPEFHILRHPNSTVSEACRVIRTNIMFCSPDKPLRSLLVTSSGPVEGKTMSVMNLGIVLAQSGHRTVIVDSDMRRPRLHKVLGVSAERGLSSIIVGESTLDDSVKTTEQKGLYALPCGPIPPNPAELLQTDRFQALVQLLLSKFDRVVFDSPPLLAVTDAAVLSRVVDGTIMVARAGRTTRDALSRAIRHLTAVNANVIGAVLNDVNVRSAQYGYYYQYHYYGSREEPVAAKAGGSSGGV